MEYGQSDISLSPKREIKMPVKGMGDFIQNRLPFHSEEVFFITIGCFSKKYGRQKKKGSKPEGKKNGGREKSLPPPLFESQKDIHIELYLITPSSLPTFIKAAIALSKCAFSCPAESCTRIRAWSLGTTG